MNRQPCSRLPGQESVSRLFPSPHAEPGPEEFECIQFGQGGSLDRRSGLEEGRKECFGDTLPGIIEERINSPGKKRECLRSWHLAGLRRCLAGY